MSSCSRVGGGWLGLAYRPASLPRPVKSRLAQHGSAHVFARGPPAKTAEADALRHQHVALCPGQEPCLFFRRRGLLRQGFLRSVQPVEILTALRGVLFSGCVFSADAQGYFGVPEGSWDGFHQRGGDGTARFVGLWLGGAPGEKGRKRAAESKRRRGRQEHLGRADESPAGWGGRQEGTSGLRLPLLPWTRSGSIQAFCSGADTVLPFSENAWARGLW